MKRNSLKILSVFIVVIATSIGLGFRSGNNDPIINKWAPKDDVVEMPIVKNSKPIIVANSFAPIEQRDEKYIRFLSSSVKINVSGASGSGTICYYDPKENWAYVISCGHLWSGNKSYKELLSKPQKAKIIIWYQNEIKLEKSKSYEAEVLFWSNTRGKDCSCLRFQPDWKPNYFHIGNVDYKFNKGDLLNSLGCDSGNEVARYEVEFLEMRGDDIITKRNSPRPGRSGGGLLTDSGLYVGICWGTSDTVSGNGIGYFTPLKSIHQVFIENGHEWIILLSEFSGRDIPIYDWKSPKKQFDWDYLPIPQFISSP